MWRRFRIDKKRVFLLITVIFLCQISAISYAFTSENTTKISSIIDSLNERPSDAASRGKPTKPPNPSPSNYEIFVEIDYMTDHTPTYFVLEYIKGYYAEQGITVTFFADYYDDQGQFVDNPYSQNVGYYSDLASSGFWSLESMFNNVIHYNDRGQDGWDEDGNGYDEEYFLKEKWVLFGSHEMNPKVVGYTYISIGWIIKGNTISGDVLSGNYIFIADETGDEWAINHEVEPYGAEAVVLMHELGHSIGIGILQYTIFGWTEAYDSDVYSVMSTLNVSNASWYFKWYYSRAFWKTKNLKYYAA